MGRVFYSVVERFIGVRIGRLCRRRRRIEPTLVTLRGPIGLHRPIRNLLANLKPAIEIKQESRPALAFGGALYNGIEASAQKFPATVCR